MEDLFPLLLFAFFVLAPLIERVLKGGRKGPPPEQRTPPKPYQRRVETVEDEDEEGEGSAADMLPDDLWAILTGETRPQSQQPAPLPPEPAPAERPQRTLPDRPAPERPAPDRTVRRPQPTAQRTTPPRPAPRPVLRPVEVEAAADEEIYGARPQPIPERFERVEYAPQDYVRPIPRHEAPIIVSMETPLESDEVRHGRFHDRLSKMAAPEVVQRGKARLHVGLHDPGTLRRGFIIAEILGKPRGLE